MPSTLQYKILSNKLSLEEKVLLKPRVPIPCGNNYTLEIMVRQLLPDTAPKLCEIPDLIPRR